MRYGAGNRVGGQGKMAVFAPMPKAGDRIAVAVNRGARANPRKIRRRFDIPSSGAASI